MSWKVFISSLLVSYRKIITLFKKEAGMVISAVTVIYSPDATSSHRPAGSCLNNPNDYALRAVYIEI
jgi:hypothetical protein